MDNLPTFWESFQIPGIDIAPLMVVIILLVLLLRTYQKRRKISAAIEPLGGEKWYPFLGTTLNIIKSTREQFFETCAYRNKTYGPIFRTWEGSLPVIHLMKAEQIEPILVSTVNLAKSNNYKFILPWLGEGLVTGAGNKWRLHRKLITPSFHFKILDNMTEIFSEKSQMLVDMLANKADGNFFDIFPLLTHCALDIICETAMGVQINAMNCSDSEYVKAVYGITDIILYRMFHPYLHPDFLFNLSSKGRQQKKCLSILHAFTRKVIQERKEKLSKGEGGREQLSEEDILMGQKKRLAFLDLLLQANRRGEAELTDEDIREEVDTFLFAGHDTTTVTVCWTLFTLSNYPEIQEKLYEELDGIFRGEERPITAQDVGKMQYLDRVIKETLRVIPVIPAIGRALDTEVEIDGYSIPAGVMATIHIYELHRDPDQFPDPERFDPDRFLPERSAGRHPYAFIPFSAGPRNCLGQKFAQRNSKVMLATILRKYKVRCLKKIDEMKYYAEIVLRPQGGLDVSLEPRK